MRRSMPIDKIIAAGFFLIALLAPAIRAQPTIRVEKSYEDTVRILVLYNSGAIGQPACAAATRPVGPLTRDFTVNSIVGIPNVKVLKAEVTQWADVQAAFGNGLLPHVIVHVNAGWTSFSGPYLVDVLNRAADQAIGVVSVGDDAAAFADKVFGFTNVNNVPPPMGDATQYKGANTNLWIALNGKADTLQKPGVIRNTVDSLKVSRLDFKPYGTDAAGDYRCQADADKYGIDPKFLGNLNFLGFQRAFNGTDTIATPTELQTIVAFQNLQRRGVALSFQPQFLKNAQAASQIVYDAIIYASYAHFYNLVVATPVATPGSSSFLSQVSVTLSTATPGATIYYTLDGTAPSNTNITSKVYDPANPIVLTGNATIKAIAYKTGWLESGIMSESYTKTFTASTLEISDENGRPLAGGYLSELNTAYTVRLITTQAGLSQVTLSGSTALAKDAESLILTDPANNGTRLTYTGTSPLAITAAGVPGNAKTEAAAYDTLTVIWTNPNDAKDVAVAKVPVRPSPRQGIAYFSTKPDGSDTTDQYQGTETKIYLVVRDEVLPPGVVPTVSLETTPKNGSGRSKDTEVINLTVNPATPGKYIAAIDVVLNPVSAPGDKKLQLQLDDLIKATYTDPMDTEPPAFANAGFGVAPDIDALLQFTDKAGNVLPPGIYFSPAEGSLYLTYKDDWVTGGIATKTVTLAIDNSGGKAPADSESFKINLVLSKRKGSTGVWEGSIALKDLPKPTAGNGTAETYVLGKVHASVTSHTKTGADFTTVSADLLVAYPNQDAQITLEGSQGPGVQVVRGDTSVKIIIHDQSLSSGKDTLYATLSCTESKDFLTVRLIEKDGEPGTYVSEVISKSEGAVVVDGTLQCKSRDYIKVSYTDIVYGSPTEIQVLLDSPVTTRIHYALTSADSLQINTVSESDGSTFWAVVTARSPTVDKVDSIQLTMTTAQGESETFWAVETGAYTEKFLARIPYGFVNGAIAAGNGKVEGKLTATNRNNQVTATGSVTLEGNTATNDINLIAAYVPVVKAYITDEDGNGSADRIYVQFLKNLSRLPATLDGQWNLSSSSYVDVSGASLSFLPGSDSTIVVADFSGKPFGAGLTSIPAGEAPRAKLPTDPLFGAQSPLLDDSIGPVILAAVKHPVNVNSLKPGDPSFNLDTLIITLSEPIKTSGDFKQVLKFSPTCGDYAGARTINAVNSPSADGAAGNRYVIIVDNSSSAVPQTGNCVYLNADGPYTDLPGNLPPKTGFKLQGGDRDRILQLFRGYPPVAGLDPNDPNYQVAVQDSRDQDKSGIANSNGPTWVVNWIPPVGFNEDAAKTGNPEHGPIPHNATDSSSGETDPTRVVAMPAFLSTVQVVATAPYIADVSIFDNLGNFVVSFRQAFGYRGELGNSSRVVPKGLVSYLWWNTRDSKGQFAGQGVYVWKAAFHFQNGKQEVMYTRTGLIRLAHN